MTGTRRLTLIIIGLLCGLFIYVAEDIPPFGDPEAPTIKYVELFQLELSDIEEIGENSIPSKLIEKLKERDFPPITRIETVSRVQHEWNAFISKDEPYYPKEEKYYFLRKEGNLLKVYRYPFVVRWVEKGLKETAVPNMVTYGLADYRGYDTLGETTVIFTAGVSVILLLRRKGKL